MAWAKAKTAVVLGVGVVLAAGITTTVVFHNEIEYQFTLAGGKRDVAKHLATPVDLTAQGGVFSSSGRGSDWDSVPSGFHVFHNVPFQINSQVVLWGARNAVGGATFPEEVLGVGVNQKFESLYIYHTAFFASPNNTPVFEAVLRYEDGSSATNQLLYGSDILEWAGNPSRKATTPKGPFLKTANDPTGPNSRLAWMGGTFSEGKNRPLRFCMTSVVNPKPTLRVTAIDLYSCKSPSAPSIMAMTIGRAGLMK